MENKPDYDVTRLINNYAVLKVEFENYEEGKSYFASRDDILNLMISMQNDLREVRKAKLKKLDLNDKKNNSIN